MTCLLAGLVLFAVGCAETEQFNRLEGLMDRDLEPVVEGPGERTSAEYVIYYLNRRRHSWKVANWDKLNLFNLVPPQISWRFEGAPSTERIIAESSYHKFIPLNIPMLEKDRSKDIRIEMSEEQMLALMERVLRRQYLDFLVRVDPTFEYEQVSLAAEHIRRSFLRDLLLSEAPESIGPEIGPLLIEVVDTTQDEALISGCFTNLQIIAGDLSQPGNRYHPGMSPAEARKALAPWRRLYSETEPPEPTTE